MNSGLYRLLACLVIATSIANAVSLAARAAERDDPRAIFLMNADGSDVQNVIYVEAFPWLGTPRFSHDGRRIAFEARGDAPGRCMIVDTTGRNLLDLGAGAKPDWSPDDKQIVYEVPNVGASSVWVQNADGKGSSWLGNGSMPRWSPDGSHLVAMPPLWLYDLASGTDRAVLHEKQDVGTVLGCDWSPDGKRLAAVVERNRRRELIVLPWDQPAQRPVVRWQGELHSVLSWSPDGKQLALSVLDVEHKQYRVQLLEVEGKNQPRLIAGQQGDNREPAWSPDGKQLAFASSRRITARTAPAAIGVNRGVRLELVRSHDKGGSVYSVAFSPDGRTSFLGGDLANRALQVWNVSTGEVQRSINLPGIFVAVSPDGLRAACAEYPGKEVRLLNLDDGATERSFDHGAQVLSVQFSSDGSRLITAGEDHTVAVFDMTTGKEILRLPHEAALHQAAISPNRRLIASASEDKKLHLWDADKGKHLRTIEHPAVPWCVAFSPDGRTVITGTGGEQQGPWRNLQTTHDTDNTLRIWNVETGQLERELKGHKDLVINLAISPDGRRAVSASFDHTLRLWDLATGRELSVVNGKGWVTNVAFSSDGRSVLASGGTEKDREKGRWYEAPEERVRLFRVVEAEMRPRPKNQSPRLGRNQLNYDRAAVYRRML